MKIMKYLHIFGMLALTACGSDRDPVTYPPEVTTGQVSEIYREGATLHGSIQNHADANIKEYGILCSDHKSMDEPLILQTEGYDLSNFCATIRNLTPGKTYYYCAYATSGYSVMTGEVKSFNTSESNPPIFNDVLCDASSENGFTITAHIEDIGGHELLLCGFCYTAENGSGKEPTIADHTVFVEELNVDYTYPIEGLAPNTTYLVRAFAGNEQGVGYSRTIEVKTLEPTSPNVSAADVDSLSQTSISVSANVWLPEGEELTEAGFCWSSESSLPTIDHNHQNVLEQLTGNKMTCLIKDLKPETVYYVRPYAISAIHGICYGETLQFKTEAIIIPEVTPDNSIDDLPTVVM